MPLVCLLVTKDNPIALFALSHYKTICLFMSKKFNIEASEIKFFILFNKFIV